MKKPPKAIKTLEGFRKGIFCKPSIMAFSTQNQVLDENYQ